MRGALALEVNGGLLDMAVEFGALGAPIWVYSMPIAGATAPVTLAGTLALLWAEVLGTITAIQTAAPGALGIACCGPGILDMRHTTMSLGALENSLMGAAPVEIGHRLGTPRAQRRALDRRQARRRAGGLREGAQNDGLRGHRRRHSQRRLRLPGLVEYLQPAHDPGRRRDRRHGDADGARLEVSPETLMRDAIERVGIGGDYLREKATRAARAWRRAFRAAHRLAAALRAVAGGGPDRDGGGREVVRAALDAREEREPRLTEDQRRELAAVCGITVADAMNERVAIAASREVRS